MAHCLDPRTYLAHHELDSITIAVITFIATIIVLLLLLLLLLFIMFMIMIVILLIGCIVSFVLL